MEQERLWDEAYNSLKDDDPKLVAQYEAILSLEIEKETSIPGAPGVVGNAISQDDPKARWLQMRSIMDKWLDSADNAYSGQFPEPLKDAVQKSVQTAPAAVLAWTCMYRASQVLLNPRLNEKAACSGVIHIISKMDWYTRLPRLLIRDGVNGPPEEEHFLRGRVVDLYKAIFSYGMKAICFHADNLSPGVLNENSIVKDWDACTEPLTEAEYNLSLFNGHLVKKQLDEMMNIPRLKACQGAHLTSDLYRWALSKKEYTKTINWAEEGSQVLMISGVPGSGKTLLLEEIVRQLAVQPNPEGRGVSWSLASSFCGRNNDEVYNSTTVLRSLVKTLFVQQPRLKYHWREARRSTKRSDFNNTADFFALSTIFFKMLKDECFVRTYLVIDGIDECDTGDDRRDLDDLLLLIKNAVKVSSKLRCIVSTTLNARIKQELEQEEKYYHLSLDSDSADQLATAVRNIITYRVSDLAKQKGKKLETEIADVILEKSRGNFSWATMACDALLKEEKRYPLEALNEMPEGLDQLYSHAWNCATTATLPRRDQEYSYRFLSTTAIVYSPLHVSELANLAGLPPRVDPTAIVKKCYPFLEVRNDMVYFVNRQAKLYVRKHLSESLSQLHSDLTLHMLSMVLKESTDRSGQVAPVSYATLHWMNHLAEVNNIDDDTEASESIISFLDGSLMQWLAFVHSAGLLSDAANRMRNLKALLITKLDANSLLSHIQDAERILHLYISANGEYIHPLFFPKESSMNRKWREAHPWLITPPTIPERCDRDFQVIRGHDGLIRAIAFSPDGRFLASGSDDSTICIWDVETATIQRTFNDHDRHIYDLAWSCDGLLASASSDETVKIWDCTTGCLRETIPNQKLTARAISFSPDSKKLAVCTDETLRVWDLSNLEAANVQEFCGHKDSVYSVDFSPDGMRIVSAGDDHKIIIWNADTSEPIQTLVGHEGPVNSVAFSPDGLRIASGSDDETVRIWSAETGESLKILGKAIDRVFSVAFSSDGSHLASGSGDEAVRVWGMATGELKSVLKGHESCVREVAFSPRGNCLASVSDDRTIRFWDIASSVAEDSNITGIPIQNRRVDFVAMSSDGRHVASASYNTICLWDGMTGKPAEHHMLSGHSGFVNSVMFSPDGERLVSTAADQSVRLWDTASGAMLRCFEGHSEWVGFAVFSPDGQYVASASHDETVRIWDCKENGEEEKTVRILEAHDYVQAVTFSPDGKLLASGGDDSTVRVWDTTSWELKYEIQAHATGVRRVVFSPDSARIVSRSQDQIVWVCDAQTGATVQGPIETDKAFRVVAFDSRWPEYMLTEFGIDSRSSFYSSSFFSRESLRQNHYGISADNRWITWNDRNVIPILDRYQATASWVQGHEVVIGTELGEVLLFRFSKEVELPTQNGGGL